MVEVRHCDACGRRLPVEFPPNQERVCPGCGAAVEEEVPAGSSEERPPAARARAGTRRVRAPRPKTPGAGPRPSSRATAFKPGTGPSDSARMPPAAKRGPSTLVIFGGAMAAGAALVAGAALILTGDGPRRSRGASTHDHATAAVPRRRSAPPAPATDAPPETTEVAARPSPAGGTTAVVPTPPPLPQGTSPAPAPAGPAAADAPPAALALGSAGRDKKAEEDYFAKLRREMEERAAREAEARAARDAEAREAKARAEQEARERAARAARMKPIIQKNAQWYYLAGAHPRGAWTRHDYRPLGWSRDTAGFGYGDNDDRTVLNDMRYKYTVIYIRRTFDVADPADVKALELVVNYDDGFIAYVNGQEVVRTGVGNGRGAKASGVVLHEADKFERFDIKEPGRLLRKGTNVLAIEGHNVHDRSSDLTLDPYLMGLIESAPP